MVFTVKEKQKAPEVQVRVMVSARSAAAPEPESEPEPPRRDEEPAEVFDTPPPAFSMPTTSLAREPVETLAERLFDLSMDLIVAEPDEAMGMALDLLQEYVPAELSVAYQGSMTDEVLRAVEARGGTRDEILGRTIPPGEGIVGMCFEMRETVREDDISRSIPYDVRIDGVKGFQVGSALVVPMIDETSLVYGVIELLNPKGRPFLDADVEAAEMLARTLGQSLSNR
jgi:GAF domain-containing protein